MYLVVVTVACVLILSIYRGWKSRSWLGVSLTDVAWARSDTDIKGYGLKKGRLATKKDSVMSS